MDPIAVFGAPILGAACQQLAVIGWEAFTNWNKNRKGELIAAPEGSILRGRLAPLQMNAEFEREKMWEIHTDLEFLRDNYGDSGPFELDDQALLAAASRLRANLEELFGQHITFIGEDDRPESGAAQLKIRTRITNVKGNSEAAAILGEPPKGNVEVDFKADRIEDGSRAYGIKREVR
jgi:hypothetical protein